MDKGLPIGDWLNETVARLHNRRKCSHKNQGVLLFTYGCGMISKMN